MSDKKITLRVTNRSGSEAFEAAGLEIPRGFDGELEMTMEKANAVVVALSGIAAVTTSVVTDSLKAADQSYGEAELASANDKVVRLEALNSEQSIRIANLEAENEQKALKITELEDLIATYQPEKSTEAESAPETLKTEVTTEAAAPKAAAKKTTAK